MNVLVVGGTGNISTSIVELLGTLGHDVSVVVRGAHSDELSPDVRRITVDRTRYDEFESAMSGQRWDAVIDMVAFTAEHARSAIRAFGGSVGHYVVCSTVVAYGMQFTRVPTDESEPRRPTDAYGRGKAEMEDELLRAHAAGRFPVTILRPSHTYGRIPVLSQVTGLDPRFVDRVRRGRPILVVDTAGTTTWSSLHVDDAALAFAHCLGHERCFGRAYQVVGDEAYSWIDYHRRVAAVIGHDIDLVPAPVDQITAAGGDDVGLLPITAHDGWFTNHAVKRDIPEFRQRIFLEDGIRRNLEYADAHGLVQSAEAHTWQDDLIAAIR